MQVLRKEVLSAPTSFFALASLRQAVRLVCFAAASLGGVAAGVPGAATAAVAGALAGGTSARAGGAAAESSHLLQEQPQPAQAT